MKELAIQETTDYMGNLWEVPMEGSHNSKNKNIKELYRGNK
jgi:hypothetical protein